MERIFRPIEPEDYAQVRQLLVNTGWQQRVQDPDRFDLDAGVLLLEGVDDLLVGVDFGRII